MSLKPIIVAGVVCCVFAIVTCVPTAVSEDDRQVFLDNRAKETTTPDFVRLVVMRLIYGIASTMGLEERLSDLFNGAFVPPGEEDGDLDFGGDLEFDGADDLFER